MDDKEYYESLVKECKKKLNFPDIKFPGISGEEIDYNMEMISIQNEDYIILYKDGFIGPLELAKLLEGRDWDELILKEERLSNEDHPFANCTEPRLRGKNSEKKRGGCNP